MTIEILSFPIHSGDFNHGYVRRYQRLPACGIRLSRSDPRKLPHPRELATMTGDGLYTSSTVQNLVILNVIRSEAA